MTTPAWAWNGAWAFALQCAREEDIQGPLALAEEGERGAAGGQASTAGSRPEGSPTVLPAEPLTGVRRSVPTQPFKGARGRTGRSRLSTVRGTYPNNPFSSGLEDAPPSFISLA